jgi:carboxylate-amine ligase
MSAGEQHSFGSGEPYTIGVEEELFLTDPVTGAQVNASGAVLERLGTHSGEVERELHACQIELISPVCRDVGEAISSLSALRACVLETGVGLIGSGTHPQAAEGEGEITDKKRYERIRDLLGDAVATPVGGLHIHVGMPDPETAIRAFNGLRRHLPLLQALGANSPFRHGRDTGLASAREVSVRGWPRSGVPRAMADYEDFQEATSLLVRAADVPDYTWFWWKLRPHPRLGTVEIRALDAQTSLDDLAAIVALAHCLAVHEATRDDAPDGPPAEILDEASFRAARYGSRAQLPDDEGRLQPLGELLARTLDAVGGQARELGCEAELDATRRIVEQGGGAGRQRAAYALGGMAMLLRETATATAAARA